MGFVYFIEMERPHLIKIGYASCVEDRLSNLQTACPFKLSIYDVSIGTKEDERAIQRLLKPHQYRKEWFRPTDEVLEFIEDIEEYRRETFKSAIFDPEVHKTIADICEGIANVPITGFLVKRAKQEHDHG